ncbi:MAG TPA: hotdog fold domain-containing protein [Cellvibrio sp.]|nr:hotdog fold domain-containing protein [Cellvibrio sp.]
MENASAAAKLWRVIGASTLGKWLFAKIICFKAPYFNTIKPRITILHKNLCQAYIVQSRRVQNHIGCIHAIALCNLAELCAGLMTDVSLPGDMRWIPKGMTVTYLRKAKGKITARAIPVAEFYSAQEAYEMEVNVTLHDENSIEVFGAKVSMWISKKI